jgi:hypothetical protein
MPMKKDTSNRRVLMLTTALIVVVGVIVWLKASYPPHGPARPANSIMVLEP